MSDTLPSRRGEGPLARELGAADRAERVTQVSYARRAEPARNPCCPDGPMSNLTRLGRTDGVAGATASLVPSMLGVIAVSTLGILSFLTRKGSLPFDGLWFDDSWVAAGAILGRPAEILDVGSSHPSFTLLLMGVHRFGDGSLGQLGVPSLVAGVLAPPIVYLALRRLSYSRSVCFLVASALVVARTARPVLRSGEAVHPRPVGRPRGRSAASRDRPPYVAVAARPGLGVCRSRVVHGQRVPSRRGRGSGCGAGDAPSVRPRSCGSPASPCRPPLRAST